MCEKNNSYFYYIYFLNDLIFFYEFLFKFIKFSIFKKNLKFYNYFNKYNSILQHFKPKINHDSFILNFDNKTFNEFQILKISTTNEYNIFSSLNENLKNTNIRINFKKYEEFQFTRFCFLNFLFSSVSFNFFFKYHHHYHLFYLKEFKKNLVVINVMNFKKRWNDSQNFIFNIYYYNFSPLLFGSFDFKNEILSINWQYFYTDLNFWNYSFPFFTLRTNRYDTKIKYFYDKLILCDINFFIISNALYHYKNLHYFNNNKFFTLGVANSNISPWLLSYSIPVFSINFITEYCFLSLLILLSKQVINIKFIFIKLHWFYLMQSRLNIKLA